MQSSESILHGDVAGAAGTSAPRRASIRAHLLRLVLAVTLPLAGLQAWSLYATAVADSQHARRQVLHVAQVSASEIGRFLADARNVVNGLAARPAVGALDPERCDPILKDFLALAPRFANVVTMNMEGGVICSAVPAASPARGDPDRFLKRLRRPDQLTVGLAAPGVVTGRWVVPVGRPLLDAQGATIGAVVLPLDLARLPLLPSVEGLPDNAIIGLVAGDGTILARSFDAPTFIGKKLGAGHTALRERFGTVDVIGGDGVARIQGFVPVPGTDWVAIASVPASEALAGVKVRIAQSALVALVILAAALLLAIRSGRAIEEPIAAIADAAKEVAAGNLAARAPVTGTTETAHVARQLNNMLASRERADAELRESEERLSGLVASAMDGIICVNENLEIVIFNPAAEKIFGCSRADRIGEHLDTLVPRRFRAAHGRQVGAFARTGTTGRTMGSFGEITALRASGEEFPIEASIAQAGESPRKLFTVILRDVTDRRLAQAALQQSRWRQRELSWRLQEVEENERRNINRELHDRVGQNLGALNISLNLIRSQLPQGSLPAVGARFQDAQSLLEATSMQIRNVMADLHPPALDEYGLLAALHAYVAGMSTRLALPIAVQGEDPAPRLPRVVEMALFRIAQGALANAAAHASAQRVQIIVAARMDRVALTIADDGIGFDPVRATFGRPNWGLAIMRERAEAVGATLSIDSAPGRGTRIVVEIAWATESDPDQTPVHRPAHRPSLSGSPGSLRAA